MSSKSKANDDKPKNDNNNPPIPEPYVDMASIPMPPMVASMMGSQDILSEIMPMIMGGGAAGSAHHPSAAPFVMSTANPWMMMHENGTNWMPGVGSMVMGMGSNALPNKSKNKKQGGEKDKTIRAAKRSRKSKDGEEVDDDGDDKSSPTNDEDNIDINGDSQEEEEDNEPSINLVSDSWQKDVLDKIPRCKSAEGIRETSYFVTSPEGQHAISNAPIGGRVRRRNNFAPTSSAAVGPMSNISCLRKLLAELNRMEYEDGEQLPGGEAPIWLRYDDECPQYMRAIITGPSSTPYAHGLFTFDIYVPDSYPNVAPKVQLLTTGGGVMRFSPNLYANGKVCLSLLGTWSGPKWDPGHSSILQILVSIQGLILVSKDPSTMLQFNLACSHYLTDTAFLIGCETSLLLGAWLRWLGRKWQQLTEYKSITQD